jgi:hypothetical protein
MSSSRPGTPEMGKLKVGVKAGNSRDGGGMRDREKEQT